MFLTAEQFAIVEIATRRMREVQENPLLDESEVLTLVAEEYLHDAAAVPPPNLPPRRIAVE